MNSYFQEYATVAVLLAVGIIFMLALTSVAALLRPNNPSKEKLTTYESVSTQLELVGVRHI